MGSYKNPSFQFLLHPRPVRRLHSKIFVFYFSVQFGVIIGIMYLKNDVLLKISKIWKNKQNLSFWIRQKSAVFQRKSALFRSWFLPLKFFVFSAVQSWISAAQRTSGNEQRRNRPEIFLNQNWWALTISETSTREHLEPKRFIFFVFFA